LVSIFDYGDPLPAQTIVWGKYKWLPDIYRILGGLMIERLESEHYRLPGAELTLCPIPLSKERLRWRGFNQSEIIARELSRHFSWPVTPLLQRIKNTKTQKDLTRAERFTNIARSFTLADGQAITNKNIILIDDVITTGATLLEAVKVLKSAGASQVWCLTLARD
jgi:ComF family protein